MAAEEEEFWQELVMAEVGGLLDRKGKLVSTLSLYRFVDLMEILEILNIDLNMLDVETVKVALENRNNRWAFFQLGTACLDFCY